MTERLNCGGWSVETAVRYLETIIKEKEAKSEQRFLAQEKALARAEEQQDRKNQSLNELSGIVTDQQGSFARTAVVDLQLKALSDRINAVTLVQREHKGREGGLHSAGALAISAVSILIALAALYFHR